MIQLPASIYIATTPVDLHWSFDRLAGVVREQLGGDPRSESLFVFHNRRRTHAKLLWHDGSGYCVLYKRLDRGTLRIPLPVPPGGYAGVDDRARAPTAARGDRRGRATPGTKDGAHNTSRASGVDEREQA